MADYDLKKGIEGGQVSPPSSLISDLLAKSRLARPPLPSGQASEQAYAADEWKSVVDRRKAALRAQAELLSKQGL